MKLVGYFPGQRLTSDAQFGRQIHVRKQVEHGLEHDEVDPEFYLADAGEYAGDDGVHEVDTTGSFPERLWAELGRTWRLARTVRGSDDHVVLYTREGPHFAPVLAGQLPGASLVVESNGKPTGLAEEEYPFQSAIFENVRAAKWRLADRVVAVSESLATTLRDDYGVRNVTVVENGVDVDTFDAGGPVASEPPYEIIYVGGLQDYQRIDLMLDVVAALETPVTFTLVGGEDADCETYRQQAAALGIDDSVEFVGRVPHAEVPGYVAGGDLCFGPFPEDKPSAPLKVYEYLACRREVVVVNDTGLGFLSRYPGVHLLRHADPATLAARVDEILRDATANDAGREAVVADRSWRAVVDQVLDVCRTVAGEN